MGPKEGNKLAELLERNLSPEELALLRGQIPATQPADYDAVFSGVARRLSALEDQVSRNRTRIRDRYSDLEAQPEGRLQTLFDNSPPSMLVALVHGLIEQSFAERFADPRRCLELAKIAARVAEHVAVADHVTDYLMPEGVSDLRAEALGNLGNALRVNSDLGGAERVLRDAEDLRTSGTGDRLVRAELLRHLAWLRVDQGRSREAGELMDREIAIRRLLGDPEELGTALVNRGIVSPWFEPLDKACEYLMAGVELIEDRRMMLLALLPLGEALARIGQGLQAWKVACQVDVVIVLADQEAFRVNNQMIKGIALRVLGELGDAERELTAARNGYVSKGRELHGAVVALDLACVYAAQGRLDEVRRLATEAHAVFVREGVSKEALRAVLTLQQADRLSEALAVEVANFLVRSQLDRRLRFEPSADG